MTFVLQKKIASLKQRLTEKKISYREDMEIAPFTSFKIGGTIPLYILIPDEETLIQTHGILEGEEIKYKVLGGGTNVLIGDHPQDLVLVSLAGDFSETRSLGDGRFRIGGAVNTTPIFRKISKEGFTGGEFLSTVPGSFGGAVVQNAGCFGGEIFDILQEVTVFQNGKIFQETKQDACPEYRNTKYKIEKDFIVLYGTINLKIGDLAGIETSLKEKRDKRNSSQPANKKSAGSIFKNPKTPVNTGETLKSWQCIDRVGLRGFAKGDAVFSSEHCNFIVNNGKARAADVEYLINTAEEKVFNQLGIQLEKEIELLGKI